MQKVFKIWLAFSLIILLLVTTASLLGIFNSVTYSKETINWAMQGRGQDVGNIIAVICFSFSIYYLKKGSVKAYFIWLGTLIYFIYAYIIYAFFIHFNYLFLIYVSILGLSLYSLVGGLMQQNLSNLYKVFSKNLSTKFPGILLIVVGVMFALLWLSAIIPSLISGSTPQDLLTTGLWVNPIHVIDLAFVLPGMILSGVLLLKKNYLGYVFTAPWLMFSMLMGTSIVTTMILQLGSGDMSVIPPAVMISMIVFLSLASLIRYLREVTVY
jgi:hypothetical protein